jgi:hypothetical protein
MAIYYAVAIIGYWAYGSSVSEYLLNDLSGPKWAKILANTTAFLQTVVSQHVYDFFHFIVQRTTLQRVVYIYILIIEPGVHTQTCTQENIAE